VFECSIKKCYIALTNGYDEKVLTLSSCTILTYIASYVGSNEHIDNFITYKFCLFAIGCMQISMRMVGFLYETLCKCACACN